MTEIWVNIKCKKINKKKDTKKRDKTVIWEYTLMDNNDNGLAVWNIFIILY